MPLISGCLMCVWIILKLLNIMSKAVEVLFVLESQIHLLPLFYDVSTLSILILWLFMVSMPCHASGMCMNNNHLTSASYKTIASSKWINHCRNCQRIRWESAVLSKSGTHSQMVSYQPSAQLSLLLTVHQMCITIHHDHMWTVFM